MSKIVKEVIIPFDFIGSRVDSAIAELMPEFSRSKIQDLIRNNIILLNGENFSSKSKVRGGEVIQLHEFEDVQLSFEPEKIDLNIIFEDDDILVLNKSVGQVVHPGAGNLNGTLLNGLLYYSDVFKTLPRAGIVHRLDKDTSGLMVVAKTSAAQISLINQLKDKSVYREYRAITWGQLLQDKVINKPIGRHNTQRTKMSVNGSSSKEAITKVEILEKFSFNTYVRCLLKTGRTHQIRVHLFDNQSPIVGDPLYGLKKIVPSKLINKTLLDRLRTFPRQALHAISLGLIHPKSQEQMKWTIELPQDMKNLLLDIKEYEEGDLLHVDNNFMLPIYDVNSPIDFDDEELDDEFY